MTRLLLVSALVVSVLPGTADAQSDVEGRRTSQSSPLSLRSDWEHQRRHLLAVIDSATPAMLGFRPTPGVRTFAEQIDHVARVAALITRGVIADRPWPDGLDADTASYLHDRSRLRAQTDRFLGYVVEAVSAVPEARWVEDATLFRMTLSRFRWNVTALQHSSWTLGQLVPYLRLSGRTPPPFTPL